jgi:hypothetical protein
MSENVEKVPAALRRLENAAYSYGAHQEACESERCTRCERCRMDATKARESVLSLIDEQAKEIERLRDALSMATAFHVTEIGQEEITVEWVGRALRLGGGPWAVRCGGMCLNREGEWDYELLPSSRRHDWLDAHRFDSREEAFAAACDAASAALKEKP